MTAALPLLRMRMAACRRAVQGRLPACRLRLVPPLGGGAAARADRVRRLPIAAPAPPAAAGGLRTGLAPADPCVRIPVLLAPHGALRRAPAPAAGSARGATGAASGRGRIARAQPSVILTPRRIQTKAPAARAGCRGLSSRGKHAGNAANPLISTMPGFLYALQNRMPGFLYALQNRMPGVLLVQIPAICAQPKADGGQWPSGGMGRMGGSGGEGRPSWAAPLPLPLPMGRMGG